MTLDPKKEFAEIMEAYNQAPKQGKINLLMLGGGGKGKTYTIGTTAPRPVHIDSFDPGGTKGLRTQIQKGEVIADVRWEGDNPMLPKKFAEWKRTFKRRIDGGYFDHIGTYVLDSATTFGTAAMNEVLKIAGIPGEAPRFTKDYMPQKIAINNQLAKMLALPCHFILTGHEEVKEDVDDDGRTVLRFKFLTTGQGTVTIPLQFDEVYCMATKKTSQGVDRMILTVNDGIHTAKSRMAADGKLDAKEAPNLREMLKKCGMDWEDKPLLK